MPVSSMSGTSSGMGTAEQSELPAWLESLRTNDRPVPGAGKQMNFSSADLVDEDALPSWMRSDAPNSVSSHHPALRPSAIPGPNTDGGSGVPRSFSASSLIDEQSLPSWMREKESDSQMKVSHQPQPPIPASTLLQSDAVPDWMRTIQPQAPLSSPAPAPGQSEYG